MSSAICRVPCEIETFFARHVPQLAHLTSGVSGATLLLEALQHENRQTLLLPAFVCPELSAMALCAGLHVLHIDADRRTLHMQPDQ